MGIANAKVARMIINEINARYGLLGRQIEPYLEDSTTTDSVAEAKAAKCGARQSRRAPRWHLQLIRLAIGAAARAKDSMADAADAGEGV